MSTESVSKDKNTPKGKHETGKRQTEKVVAKSLKNERSYPADKGKDGKK